MFKTDIEKMRDMRLNDEEFMIRLGRDGYSFLVKYLNYAEVNDTYRRRVENIGRDFYFTMGEYSGDLNRELEEALNKRKSHKFNDFKNQLQHFSELDKVRLINVIGREDFLDYFYKFIIIELLRFIENGIDDIFPEYFEMLMDDPKTAIDLYKLANEIVLDDYEFRTMIEESIIEIIQALDYNSSYFVQTYGALDVETGHILKMDTTLGDIDNIDLVEERYQTIGKIGNEMLQSIVNFFSSNMYRVREHNFFPVLERLYNILVDYHGHVLTTQNKRRTEYNLNTGKENYKVSILNRADYHILYTQISNLIAYVYEYSDGYMCDVESEDWARFFQYYVVEGDHGFYSKHELLEGIVFEIALLVENNSSKRTRKFTGKLY
jgi:hypothetical protein